MTTRCLALLLVATSSHAAPPVVPTEALTLPAAGRGGRNPLPADPVHAQIAAGTWQPPTAGGAWRAVPVENGRVRAASGGYVYLAVESDADRVAVLQASGHAAVYVNGEPRMGDLYNTGYVRLPVALKKGANSFLFYAGRGPVTVAFSEPKGTAQFDLGDVTVPDLLVGRPGESLLAVPVLNTTAAPLAGLAVEATLPGGEPVRTPLPPLLPCSLRKVGVAVRGPGPDQPGKVSVALRLVRSATGEALDTAGLTLDVKRPADRHKRTFRSDLDGSVQYYAVVPPASPTAKPGLVLTLHGASVEAAGQAAAYQPKPGLVIVAPTNRRPYGFDWEDSGRLDALEVLRLAAREFDTDPRRVYLTGHSMGGHGTWHLGVTFPDQWAAVAPSAGWVSMFSYAGLAKAADPPPEREPFLRASNPSDTLALRRNLAPLGVYVLHGDRDTNVPVDQARTMRKELADFHPDFAYHERPGAEHWWGNACVDWPPLFEFFAPRTRPAPADVKAVSFRTASPGVSADCHWLRVESQDKPLAVSTVELTHDPGKRQFAGTSTNVRRLSLDLAHLPAGQPVRVQLDGKAFESVPWPTAGTRLWFSRENGTWAVAGKPDPGRKGPHRYGPFKEAFRNRVRFVYGTKGTPEETAWALAKARFDAEQFWYRGNGSIDVLADADFDPAADPDRNVVLYGHRRMNAAWDRLLDDTAASLVPEAGPAAALFVRPRRGSDTALVGVVAGTGVTGLRLADRLPYFQSGTGYPDWFVLDPNGVRTAGYFDDGWRVTEADTMLRK